MRKSKILLAGAALLAFGWSGSALAQSGQELNNPYRKAAQELDSPYIIYAKGGRVNYVAGSVTRQRTEGDLREMLAVRDNLESGEVVRTGVYGRVEVLLNPGSYLRTNSTSEFAFINTDLDNLRLRLVKGSFLLEVMGPEEVNLALTLETPQTMVSILKRGIYRLNVGATGTQVIVQKGRANVGATLVKGGNQITLSNSTATLAKFDKKLRDGFDQWSLERSETLASINGRITDRDLRNSLAQASMGNWFGRLAGLWIYDPYRNCYTFLPYSRYSWSSPYGWNYYSGLDYNNFMQYCDQRWTNPNPTGGGGPIINPSAGRQGQVVNSGVPSGITASAGDRSPGPKGNSGSNSRSADGEARSERRDRNLLIKRDPDYTGGYGSSSDIFSGPSSAGRPSNSGSSNSGTVIVAPAPASAPAAAPSSAGDAAGGNPKKPNR